MSESSSPSSPLTAAAVPLMRPSQRMTGTGTRSPETGKFSTALAVSPPHNCLSVTDMVLNLPRSTARALVGRAPEVCPDLPKPPTRTLAAPEGGVGLVHTACLEVQPPHQLGVQALAVLRAPVHRADQVPQPDGRGRVGVVGGLVGQFGRRAVDGDAQLLQVG